MRFWDASAIVPLLVDEPATDKARSEWLRDLEQTVWWGTEIECVSALARLERDGALSSSGAEESLGRLDALSLAWVEVEPVSRVREIAIRVLRTHQLRAADALQLAAAIVAAEERPTSQRFVTLDMRLADAAAREGFAVDLPSGGS